jgi:hypothetical protein
MSDSAKSPLVGQVESTVLATFDVSPDEARQRAEWLAEEAERWGGGGVALLDWNYQVRKWFEEELKWRSEAERRRFFAEQQSSAGAYETYLRNRNQPAPPPGPAVVGDRPVTPKSKPPPPVRVTPVPKPVPLVDAAPVEESPVLMDEEQALGFELREVLHLSDVPGWEQVAQISLPVLDRPPRLDAKGRTPDSYRTSVVKILSESDAIFRARQAGKRVYSHLRFGYGSCWTYATFGGGAAWHPVSDPYDSARAAVARASVMQENPAVSVDPVKFLSRPARLTP